mmetsp:Transcript_68669/g.183295  ORF Transcript_68669/g.183295 Transcript_68669/m.183295 type:complete len:306 (+) Transcript_68669:199-1116(+)
MCATPKDPAVHIGVSSTSSQNRCPLRDLLHGTELESALGSSAVRVELEATRLIHHRRLLLLVHTEVGLEDLDRHVVDLVVLVPLEFLDSVDTTAHLNHRHERIRVCTIKENQEGQHKITFEHTIGIEVALSALEDVLDPLEGNRNNTHIRLVQQVNQRRNATLVDEILDLHIVTTRSCVRDRPSALFTDIEVFCLKHSNKGRNDVVVNHSLKLIPAARCDVGNGPAGLLSDALAVAGKEGKEARQDRAVDDKLSLVVITSDDIANSPQCRSLDLRRLVHQQLNQPSAHTRINDGLDLLIGAVREV